MPDIDKIIAFLRDRIADHAKRPADPYSQRMVREHQDEIIELEDLRDGHLTLEQLGTAGRFFNRMPEWATYGT